MYHYHMIEKKIPLPLYWQIKEKIKEEVAGGKWRTGERIYTEEEIQTLWGVSRTTAIRTLDELKREGYVVRQKGRGTILIPREEELKGRLVYLLMQTKGHVYHPLAESIMRNLNDDGYHTLAYDFENSNLEERWSEILSFGGEAMVINALSVFPFPLLDRYIQELPFLVFVLHYENEDKEYRGGYVLSDYFQGGYLAGKHLAEKGYEKLWVYTHSVEPRQIFHQDMLEGVKRGWKGEETVICEDAEGIEEKEKIERVKEQFLARGKNCGVVCNGDFRALTIYKAIRELGWRIPEDIGITGYFNTPWSEALHPTLTSISVREEDIGRECARLIKERKEERVVISPLLVERESTRR